MLQHLLDGGPRSPRARINAIGQALLAGAVCRGSGRSPAAIITLGSGQC